MILSTEITSMNADPVIQDHVLMDMSFDMLYGIPLAGPGADAVNLYSAREGTEVTALSPLLPSGNAHAVVHKDSCMARGREVIPNLEHNILPNPSQGVGSHSSQDLVSFNGSMNHASVGKFKCSICLKPFLRRARAEACENRHTGAMPYICPKACGNVECTARFSSKANLARHCASEERRNKVCENCGRKTLRQNMARHRKKCPAQPIDAMQWTS